MSRLPSLPRPTSPTSSTSPTTNEQELAEMEALALTDGPIGPSLPTGSLLPPKPIELPPDPAAPDWAKPKRAAKKTPLSPPAAAPAATLVQPVPPTLPVVAPPVLHTPPVPVPVAGLTAVENAAVVGAAAWIAGVAEVELTALTADALYRLGLDESPAEQVMGDRTEFGRRLKTKVLTNKNTALNPRMSSFARWLVSRSGPCVNEPWLLGVVLCKLAVAEVVLDLAARESARLTAKA